MSVSNVRWVLRADAAFNMFAGIVLYFFQRPIIALLLLPDTNKPIYANVLGAALIGLSLNAWLVSKTKSARRLATSSTSARRGSSASCCSTS